MLKISDCTPIRESCSVVWGIKTFDMCGSILSGRDSWLISAGNHAPRPPRWKDPPPTGWRVIIARWFGGESSNSEVRPYVVEVCVCVDTGHDRTPSAASRQRVTYPLGKEISRFLRAIKAFRDPFCNESGTIFPARDHRSNYNVLANEREIALTELNFFFFFILLPGLPTAYF